MGIETLEGAGMRLISKLFSGWGAKVATGGQGQHWAGIAMVFLLAFPVLAVGQNADSPERDSTNSDSTNSDVTTGPGAAAKDPTERASQGQLILVIGASGTAEFEQGFVEWSQRWKDVAQLSGLSIQTIGLSKEPSKVSDRELLKQAVTTSSSEQGAPMWLVLIGHGTYARDIAKFNLQGPDVSATDLSKWLGKAQQPVVIINCASSSGPFVNRLSGPNRVVVTATRSGIEQNYARFGEYFSEAIGSPDSDLDHDGEVSVHEAFLRASYGVRRFYESESRIATEHALIDDNGDGKGTPASMFRGLRPNAKAKDGVSLDGAAALRVTLAPAGRRLPFTRQEIADREAIETELAVLRAKADDLDEQTLDAALLPLLLRLAEIYQTAESRAATEDEK